MAVLAFEGMHVLADAIDATLRFFALPFQMRQRRRSTSATITAFAFTRSGLSVDKSAGSLRCVPHPHSKVKPIENRRLRNPRIGQSTPQTGTTVSIHGHLGLVGLPQGFQVSPDQPRDVSVGLRHRREHLSPSGGGLNVADTDLQVALAVFTAADEGRS